MNWTPEQTAFLKKYLKGKIDSVWNFWPPRLEARKAARGRRWDTQICAACKKEYLRSETHVDHISPTVKVDAGFQDWGTYIERKFVQVSNLQVLCIPCHKIKSKAETKERAKWKRQQKSET